MEYLWPWRIADANINVEIYKKVVFDNDFIKKGTNNLKGAKGHFQLFLVKIYIIRLEKKLILHRKLLFSGNIFLDNYWKWHFTACQEKVKMNMNILNMNSVYKCFLQLLRNSEDWKFIKGGGLELIGKLVGTGMVLPKSSIF